MLAQLDQTLPEVVHFRPKERYVCDRRGYFRELHRLGAYRDAAIALYATKGLRVDGHYWRWEYVQDNFSWSFRHVLRGLHYQRQRPQGKLISVLEGQIYDVALDVRVDSDTFGRWTGFCLSSQEQNQVYIPPGFAHGFLVLSSMAAVLYKCTQYYEPDNDMTIRWDDPDVRVKWPLPATVQPTLSHKDANGYLLKDIDPSSLPRMRT